MGRGVSNRPQYPNDWAPPPPSQTTSKVDVWRHGDDQNKNTGQDAWRSYREDRTTPSDDRDDRMLNPGALEFLPADALASRPQLRSNTRFKPHEPLRFSNGTSEVQLVKSFRNSALDSSLTESRHSYSARPMGAEGLLHSPVSDRPLPSIELETDSALKIQAGFDEFRRSHHCRNSPQDAPYGTVSPPTAPEASEVYLGQARLPPVRRSTPKKCLVILDLNGTCIARPNLLEPKAFRVRPGIHKLFDYLFEHHVVMIFTSMHRKNAAAIVDGLFTSFQRSKLAGFWARDKLGLTAEQLHMKTQTYKNLIPIWLDRAIQSTHPTDQGRWGWDQSNTVLIDDSHLKAASHPHNLLLVPEFSKKDAAKERLHISVRRREETILESLIMKLEELKYYNDVSRLILQWQTGKAQIPANPRSGLVMEEEMKTKAEEHVELLTPESTIETLSEDSQDDEVHQEMSAQMKIYAEDADRRERAVSDIPDTIWADLLNGTHTNS